MDKPGQNTVSYLGFLAALCSDKKCNIRPGPVLQYLLRKKGPLATTGCDHGAFVSTTGECTYCLVICRGGRLSGRPGATACVSQKGTAGHHKVRGMGLILQALLKLCSFLACMHACTHTHTHTHRPKEPTGSGFGKVSSGCM